MELSYRTLAAGAAYLFTSVTRIHWQGAGALGAPRNKLRPSFGTCRGCRATLPFWRGGSIFACLIW